MHESYIELGLQEFFIGDHFLDSDDQQRLILSPAQQVWFDQIPDTVYLWPEVGTTLFVLDSEIQRPGPFIFRDRFEP